MYNNCLSEILEHIENLKLKKACGKDNISNEMRSRAMESRIFSTCEWVFTSVLRSSALPVI